MSQLMKWVAASGVGIATMCFAAAVSPTRAAADDAKAFAMPAVVQTTVNQETSVPVQPVYWRRGWVGPGVAVYGGGWRPGVGVYVGPRVYGPGYYAPRYYGAYYPPYPAYGYAYPGYYGYGW